MKKKTKSKQKNSLLVPFIIVILICLLGTGISALVFYNSFFRSLSKQGETPVATITFKYKTAQRKFLERVVWDRLRQNSPVYNGDTIHTAALSEATLWFSDGTSMELAENTMAQVFISEDGTLVAELSDGFASVDASESQNGATLSMNGVTVGIESGAAIAGGAGNGASLQVLKGSASLKDSNGNDVQISKGESLMFTEKGLTAPPIFVTTPLQNAKALYSTTDTCSVNFSWQLSKDFCDTLNNTTGESRDAIGARIIISQDKNFSNIIKTIFATSTGNATATPSAQTATVELSQGMYYWKAEAVFSLNTDATSTNVQNYSTQTARLQVVQSLAPEIISPTINYSYIFRNKNPAVRFIWTESTLASSYRLEVSDSASFSNLLVDQRTNFTTSIISTLGQGKYWWRVTPYYVVNKIGFTKPSPVGTFLVEKKGTLNAPVLFVPSDGGIVRISDTNATLASVQKDNSKKIDSSKTNSPSATSFSWRMEREADHYVFSVSNNAAMKNPRIVRQTPDNFILLDVAEELGDGSWYWNVVQYDENGNTSPVSETRSFTVVRGNIEQHTIEPANAYRVAASFLPDTRFTWKRTLPEDFESVLQISRNESFTNIAYEAKVEGTAQDGISLPIGTYWWRLLSSSTLDSSLEPLATPAKILNVVPPLDAPLILEPKSKISVRSNKLGEFKWDAVPNADYYKVQILQDNDTVLEEVVYSNSLSVDMFKSNEFKNKTEYNWSVQAFTNEVPGVSSRLIGKLSKADFVLNKVNPVQIVSPQNGARFDGIGAILNPPFVIWRTEDELSLAQIVLRKIDVSPAIEVLKVPSDYEIQHRNRIAPSSVKLDVPQGLQSGIYEIEVRAKTLDGVDISNTEQTEVRRFTVLSAPPLNTATGLSATPPLFNAEYLSGQNNERAILLSWNAVPQATDYHVTVFEKNGKPLLQYDLQGDLSCKIQYDKLSKNQKIALSEGTFKWTVQGLRKADSNNDGVLDKIIQRGGTASSTFVVAIPSVEKPKIKGVLRPYDE